MEDRKVIESFVAHLQGSGHPGLKIDRWPDRENRNSPEIDAIAGKFAIEHTSVDTLPHQRSDSDRFGQVIEGLEDEFPSIFPFRLRIILEYGAVTKGQNWSAIREALKAWIKLGSPRLGDGRHLIDDIPGVSFPVQVTKWSDRPPGVVFGRLVPQDDSLPARIREHLDHKAGKLANYQKPGTTTVLLVENNDIALMNQGKMLEAIQEAYPGGLPSGVDEVWYADTTIPSKIEFLNVTPELVPNDGDK